MQHFKAEFEAFLASIKGSSNFDSDQKVAFKFFALAVAKADTCESLTDEWKLFRRYLNRRSIAEHNEKEKKAIRRLILAWNPVVPAEA